MEVSGGGALTGENPELRNSWSFQEEVPEPPRTPGRSRGVRSAQGLTYEAQVSSIKAQIGSIEDVRTRLNLSRRQIAQLLLVDPSAWTRWTSTGRVPAHIYRALQWYLIIQEKIPGLTSGYFLRRGLDYSVGQFEGKVQELVNKKLGPANQDFAGELRHYRAELMAKILGLEAELGAQRQLNRALLIITVCLTAGFGLWIIYKI